jgi:dTMP kinase
MGGKFIVFEGIDASGKETQKRLLAQQMRSDGYTVREMEFPDYESPIGKAIEDFLSEDYDIDRYTAALLYAADRRQHNSGIDMALKSGYVVLSDRYFYSNVVYNSVTGIDGNWLVSLDSTLVMPDLVVLFDLDPEVALARLSEKDRNEKDSEYMKKVRQEYLRMFRGEIQLPGKTKWEKVDASKSVEEVAKQVKAVVYKYL